MKDPNTKLKISGLILVFVFLFLHIKANAQVLPTFIAKVHNMVLADTLGGDDNVLFFDIYLQHLNASASGPFELDRNQYSFNFNPAIANGGTLSYTIVPGSSQFSNPGAIPTNPTISDNILSLESNSSPGPGNGPIINAVFPGTRVVTMRLATTAPSFSAGQFLNLAFRIGLPDPYTRIFAYINNQSTEITRYGAYDVEPYFPCLHCLPFQPEYPITINLNMFIEGFYNPATNQMLTGDTISYSLRGWNNPYTAWAFGKTFLNSNGQATITFGTNIISGYYYLVIKHRNSIETWSTIGGTGFTQGLNIYDFTASSDMAYGNNLLLKGTKYNVYSGDINQDGIIDAADLSLVDNAAFIGLTGYVNTDVTGDNFVDASDISIVDNNVLRGIVARNPIVGDVSVITTR